MKNARACAILCARILAIALFCVGATVVATLPFWGKHLLRPRSRVVTVDSFCAVDLSEAFGEADYFVVSGPDGERTFPHGLQAEFWEAGEYLVRSVRVGEDGATVTRHTLSVRRDELAPTAELSCAVRQVALGTGFFVRAEACDDRSPVDVLALSVTAENATVTACEDGYLVFPDAVGDVTVRLSVRDYAGNESTATLLLTALPSSQDLRFVCEGKVGYDDRRIVLWGEGRAQTLSALPVGAYELLTTGGTVTLTTSTHESLAFTQKRLAVEVTEQGAFINGVWVKGLVYLSFSGRDVSLSSSSPLFS